MPKGSQLSEFERGQILTFKEEKRSNKWISKRIGRTMCVIRNFLADPAAYGSKKSTGRPKVLKPRERRRILADLSNNQKGINSSFIVRQIHCRCTPGTE